MEQQARRRKVVHESDEAFDAFGRIESLEHGDIAQAHKGENGQDDVDDVEHWPKIRAGRAKEA
ncbi:hypothetical protein D3C72_2490180 [compost metagenome]